jgi:hypothetical protein
MSIITPATTSTRIPGTMADRDAMWLVCHANLTLYARMIPAPRTGSARTAMYGNAVSARNRAGDGEVTFMNSDERLVLDDSFERAVARVVDVCVREELTIRALNRGTLRRPSIHGSSLRYALLEASLPELPFDTSGMPGPPGCRLCLVELTGSRTLVTVERPLEPHPLLVSPLCVARRIAKALRLLVRHDPLWRQPDGQQAAWDVPC